MTILAGSSGFIFEGAGSGSISVVLSQQPSADVYVIASADSRVSISPDTLTFTAANYSTSQAFSVTAVDDGNDNQGIDTVYVTYSVESSDTDFDGVSAGRTEVRVSDNAMAQPEVATDVASQFHFDSEVELLALRDTLINWLFPAGTLPTKASADSVTAGMTFDSYMNPTGVDSLLQVDRLYFEQDTGFGHYVYHLIPNTRNNKLMVINYGHGDAYAINGLDSMFREYVNQGYDVITSYMTARGGNVMPAVIAAITAGSRHESVNGLRRYEGAYNPLKWMVEPTILAVNHLDSVYNYDNIYLCGISGGGWLTAMLAAIDTRFEKSFDVAGTSPLFVRDYNSEDSGDYEQAHSFTESTDFVRDFFADKVGYLDLYVLGTTGGRTYYQITNLNDSCCFDGLDWKVYVPEVKRRLQNLPNGVYKFSQYNEPGQHTFNSEAINYINVELNQ